MISLQKRKPNQNRKEQNKNKKTQNTQGEAEVDIDQEMFARLARVDVRFKRRNIPHIPPSSRRPRIKPLPPPKSHHKPRPDETIEQEGEKDDFNEKEFDLRSLPIRSSALKESTQVNPSTLDSNSVELLPLSPENQPPPKMSSKLIYEMLMAPLIVPAREPPHVREFKSRISDMKPGSRIQWLKLAIEQWKKVGSVILFGLI